VEYGSRSNQDPAHFGAESDADGNSLLSGQFMNGQPIEHDDMPAEIDFSKGVRGAHHIPPGEKVFLPASIEKYVWEYFAGKAEQKGIELSTLLTEVLRRDIEINEALK
jgi:hypothetical protein